MKRLLIFSGKGGCGKTNLARHMAAAAAADGLKVATVDIDPQRGLTHWWSRRKGKALTIRNIEADWEDAAELIRMGAMADQYGPYDIQIIDTPAYGGYGDQPIHLSHLIRGSDMVLMPARPTIDDAESTIPMMKAAVDNGVPAAFVLNAVSSQSNILAVKRWFSDAGEVCPIEIGQRVIFSDAAASGETVLDLRKSKKRNAAIDEMQGVWIYARRHLGFRAKAPEMAHGD